jgi:hypothetical protein
VKVKMRRSTIILIVTWLVTLALWVLVRPERPIDPVVQIPFLKTSETVTTPAPTTPPK